MKNGVPQGGLFETTGVCEAAAGKWPCLRPSFSVHYLLFSWESYPSSLLEGGSLPEPEPGGLGLSCHLPSQRYPSTAKTYTVARETALAGDQGPSLCAISFSAVPGLFHPSLIVNTPP